MKHQSFPNRSVLRSAAFIALVLATSTATQAQTFTTLYTFTGGNDGGSPQAGLIMDIAGNLYGTTGYGGGISGCSFACGTAFMLDPFGNEKVQHAFTGGTDGARPFGDLIMDAAGNLYGTTLQGGAFGLGVVFKLDPLGNEMVLHSFAGSPDGAIPFAGLVMDAAGNLYGTTSVGGASSSVLHGVPGLGTVFKIDPAGNETVLYSFSGPDGDYPTGSLIMDAAGNLYGTTSGGGACGLIFKLDSSGNETVLYYFTCGADGSVPESALIMDAAGNLYGTAFRGGASGFGTVFKLDTSRNLKVLHTFSGGSDGASPAAALIMDAAGNLYGTTSDNDNSMTGVVVGTVFKLDHTTRNETILHTFIGSDGGSPRGDLFLDAAGNLYGTSSGGGSVGGAPGSGTVFKLSVLTPQQATQAIINSVNALFAQGVLNGGQDNSLVAQLQHAITLMNAGKNAGASGNLESFISEVNDLLNSGVLTPSQAAPLVSAAESVIARLS